MAEEQIRFLEERVAALEQLVLGPPGFEGSSGAGAGGSGEKNLADELTAVHTRMARLAQQHEVVPRFWTAHAQAAGTLNTHTFEDSLLSTGAKEEIILTAESTIREMAEQLQALEALGDFLNTSALQDVPALSPKLSPLEKLNMTNQEDLNKLSQRAATVMSSYNEIVSLLSRKFLLWDRAVSELERRVGDAAASKA